MMLAGLLVLVAASSPSSPDFSLSLEPATVPQGGVVVLRARPLTGHGPRELTVTWKDITAQGVAWKGGELMALVPVKLQQKPGTFPLTVWVTDARGTRHKATVSLTVTPGAFDTDELGVKRSFTEPNKAQRAQAKADQETFEALWKTLDRPRRWRGPFLLPVDNSLTAKFGTYRTINGHTKSRHMGLDVRGKRGDSILASNDGRVAVARPCFYSGNTVALDHGNGVVTLYFHMTRMAVKAGQLVKRGQLLGTVGDTGRVTGPHLHWGVKFSSVYVDPARVMALPLDEDPRLPARMAPASYVEPVAATEDAGLPDAALDGVPARAADAGDLLMSIPEDIPAP
jgi:hypothetical protein